MSEIKNPLIVESRNWNKLLYFVKALSDMNLKAGSTVKEHAIVSEAKNLLEEIGELHD